MSDPFVIYLTHHSHCDLGYTHDLPIIRELQRRFIDDALDLADRYADRGQEASFRWTCEVTAVVEHWLRSASPRQVERFVEANRRGQIEVCALWCNLTPLASLGQLVEMLAPLHRLRGELGLSVKAAMNSDVNGFSWALADLLRGAGITGLTMSINEHFGRAPQPFPGLFRWRTPTGGTLPVWNGPTYAHTSWLGFGGDPAALEPRLKEFIGRRQAQGWEHRWLYMQITHPGPQNDNMGPIAHFSPWVENFNARYGDTIRLVITTPSRFFEAIQPAVAKAAEWRGEWNDWWSFGTGSTPFETSLFRRATAKLDEADLLSLIGRPRNHAELRAGTQDALAHYIEHTWGADTSVHYPEDEDSRVQGRHKEKFAYDAFSGARMLRRDGLGALAEKIDAPAGPGVVLYNPTPFSRCETIKVARRILESTNLPPAADEPNPSPRRWPVDGAYQHFVDRNLFGGSLVDEIGPVALSPFGWKVVTSADRAESAPGLVHNGREIGNGRLTLGWQENGFGLSSLRLGEREWIAAGPVAFGGLIVEDLFEGNRSSIMVFDDSAGAAETRRPVWNSAPPMRRALAEVTSCRVIRDKRSLQLIQEGELPFTGGVSVEWRLSADHDDVEITVKLKKLPEPQPHSIYLALPFDLPGARSLVETAGLVVDTERDALPNGCPWWSIQGGFAMAVEKAAAYVATPDAPMVAFNKLALGASEIEGAAFSGDGLAFAWLYNNYWETNFKADARGVLTYRLRISLSANAVDLGELTRTTAMAAHPVAAHPLPDAGAAVRDWPLKGELFTFGSRNTRFEGCIPEAEGESWRLVLANTGGEADEVCLGSRFLHIGAAACVDPEGVLLRDLDVNDGNLRVEVPARGSLIVRIKLAKEED